MNDGTSGEAMVRGITGLLMAFAAREGFEVRMIEPIQLTDAGVVEVAPRRPRARGDLGLGAHAPHAAQRRAPVVLEYHRVGLSNMNFKPGHARRMRSSPSLADDRVILKAASHLPQDINFTAFTQLVLAQAPTIVQDETGVAYDALTGGSRSRCTAATRRSTCCSTTRIRTR
jgi:hypothetical protein